MDKRERGQRTVDAIFGQRAANNVTRRSRSVRPSEIGSECQRKLWLKFRWCDQPEEFGGRMLRLFDRGHREEEVFIRELKLIGAEVDSRDLNNPLKQIGFSAVDGHVNGFLDAIARNLVGSTADEVVVEFKTHSDKSFKQLEKHGVEKSKPAHYAQMQLYMHMMDFDEAFYLAVNKNDDNLYGEFVSVDHDMGKRMMENAENIVFGALAPPKINENPTFYVCKMCSCHPVCHGTDLPDKTCRVCEHSRPATYDDMVLAKVPTTSTNLWICENHGNVLNVDAQLMGCGEFEYSAYLIDELKG